MHAFSSPRLTRAAIGLAAVSAFAIAPMAAQAAGSDLTGTLGTGGLTNSAPPLTAFGNVMLTGVAQDVYTAVGPMNVNDLTGSNLGYIVSVHASAPTVNGSVPKAGTGGSIALTPQAMSKTALNPFSTVGPVASTVQTLSGTDSTIQTAFVNTGQGSYDTPGDSGGTPGPVPTGNSLHVVIPADVSAGAYVSTLTFTSSLLP
jgi:hypothetical protein